MASGESDKRLVSHPASYSSFRTNPRSGRDPESSCCFRKKQHGFRVPTPMKLARPRNDDPTSSSRLALPINLPQLAFDFPIVAVHVEEALRQLQCMLHRIRLQQRVTADHFLGLGERAVRNLLLA